jgi:hypothetical protein
MPGSFADPHVAHGRRTARGTDPVALTDHNTPAGVAEIAHHPDVVMGVESTICSPQDTEPLHVPARRAGDAARADPGRARGTVHDPADRFAAGRRMVAADAPGRRVAVGRRGAVPVAPGGPPALASPPPGRDVDDAERRHRLARERTLDEEIAA